MPVAQGACPGQCGFTGSVKAVTSHMGGCSKYAERWAAGDDLPSPEEAYRALAAANAAERRPAPAPRPSRATAPELSVPPATVSAAAAPKRAPRRPAAAGAKPERTPQPVYVETWDFPSSL